MGGFSLIFEICIPRSAGRSSKKSKSHVPNYVPVGPHPLGFPQSGGLGPAPGSRPQFGTQIGGGQRNVGGYQTDQPGFFRQGNRTGVGMPGTTPNVIGGRSGRGSSGRNGSQGGRPSMGSASGRSRIYAPQNGPGGGRSQGGRSTRR
jgi:hypothetical protein